MTRAGIGMIAALGLSTSIASAQESVEVLHWWTSGGEAKALQVLKKDLEDQGVSWNDMPVAGGGGEQAMTVLRARVTSGNAPTAVQMLGFDIKDWAGEGVLANLDELAAEEGWEDVVPEALKGFSKYDGHWIAAPVNVHSTNWVWANKAIFDELGLKQPTNWDELIAALDKIKEAGYTAVAHGGQAWQDATIFDAVVMATGGPDFYQASMIDTDPDALGSDTMKTVFDRMAKLRTYVDDNFSGRDWNLATAMVINKEAGVQFMGDWAKGEFLNAGKVPDTDFLCFRFPGTQDAVTFNSDQFVMFQVGEDRRDAQLKLASAVMSPSFQSAFNVVKGSVPARTDVPNDDFDACGKKGMAELAAANEKGTLFGSMAHGHSVPAGVKNAMYDVITAHFNGEYDSATAVEELVNAVESAQ
ncbi:sugar ABC transporter substrate-binding protein [Thalassospira lucentensis]|uniref:Probable sugar-binding periplasmic protein n=3 Tax=Thalassospiraceae TaxID=2844866 RepID=A0A367XGZ6_9PROT|nr:sugar ABC transporter substrate-binding protein [Thalassospira xiamenensis]KZB69509.1 sugar ABC transporter substrate-binding protein [Thalassospira lucentensis]RCK31198.1 sugar ABC transporter substrate-binding protein [Thalassospira xiamenensis]RCK52916.1 sugar ABC transporter substrate-binding protein [Thalassospira xiamenensis]